MKSAGAGGATRPNRHLWVLDPLLEHEACSVRTMFGAKSCYFNELLVLVLADKQEPWSGILVPTERENHEALMKLFPVLTPHPVLPKWLYLPEAADSFEEDAQKIVDHVRRLDPRFGIIPPKKKKKAAKKKDKRR